MDVEELLECFASDKGFQVTELSPEHPRLPTLKALMGSTWELGMVGVCVSRKRLQLFLSVTASSGSGEPVGQRPREPG